MFMRVLLCMYKVLIKLPIKLMVLVIYLVPMIVLILGNEETLADNILGTIVNY